MPILRRPASMNCTYCGETVIIPQSLRIPAARAQFQSSFEPASPSSAYIPFNSNVSVQRQSARSRSWMGWAAVFIIIAVSVCALAFFALGVNPFGSLFFANKVMTFGSEGIGPGLFESPRGIGVDGNGNIVVADSEDGRIQIFDANGKFISTFTVNKNGKPANILNIAVSRDGKIYVPSGDILVFDESGKQIGIFGAGLDSFEGGIALGPDGRLYGITFAGDTLVRFNADGSVDLQIPNAISAITGGSGGFPHLAVDGLGNIYIASDSPPVILKYSPDGKFVDQIGGEAKDHSQFEPGKFMSPLGVAIDGYGRIYVNDEFDLQILDSSGKYITDINGGYYGIAFDINNNLYTTPVTKSEVDKFQIQKPSGQ